MSEERTSRVNEFKAELRQKHGTKYSSIQYALWAELIVCGTHENMDDPPPAPMFGAQRPLGRASTGNLAETLTDWLTKLLVPYHQLLVVLQEVFLLPENLWEVNLRDIGALTDVEYEEQRSVQVSLMRKLQK